MSTPDRMDPALQGADGTGAYADQQARIAADAASMLAGNAPGHDEQTTHHQGMPTVETQMVTHGAAPPHTPDTGGHQSAADPVC